MINCLSLLQRLLDGNPYAQLFRWSLLATNGNPSAQQVADIKDFVRNNAIDVYLAMDADDASRKVLGAFLRLAGVKRLIPSAGDWNDALMTKNYELL